MLLCSVLFICAYSVQARSLVANRFRKVIVIVSDADAGCQMNRTHHLEAADHDR
jgi:hypothetical protein